MDEMMVALTPKDLAQLRVKVKVDRTIGPRFWLMARLMKFAAWVGGMGIDIEVRENKNAN